MPLSYMEKHVSNEKEVPEMQEVPDEDDAQYLTYGDIYKELLANEEVILEIDKSEEQRLRRRLSVLKSKDLAKFKEAGIGADDSKLEFITIEDPTIPKSRTKIQIVMKTKVRIRVYSFKIPDGSLV